MKSSFEKSQSSSLNKFFDEKTYNRRSQIYKLFIVVKFMLNCIKRQKNKNYSSMLWTFLIKRQIIKRKTTFVWKSNAFYKSYVWIFKFTKKQPLRTLCYRTKLFNGNWIRLKSILKGGQVKLHQIDRRKQKKRRFKELWKCNKSLPFYKAT